MAAKSKCDKKQHIQVFARVRPQSSQELRSQVIVDCVSTKEVTVKDKSQTKTFTFDRVFGPDSKQVEIYKTVVSPLIQEVLQGYNCTVFAYGQTGTGKTFTMVGDKSEISSKTWEQDPSSGIIPRTLSHLFDELKVRADEFTVRVSFLELYNEELCDLLAPIESDDGKSLKLFEDSMKKGSVIVSGLEERTVHNKDDVYAILEAGNLRRQTAPTLMNAQSSRSHTIFTITVHIKVTTPEGEDLIKTGKLNLVDLAGSENIGRSGAVEMRAREAGSINQSLLTLGRVITSLVERTPHVPYRESKLTRILQDSLGGRTKTSIIATVSPALCNIEETLSTFDYAHRARNITNKPEINQKTSKRVLLKEYTEEIERLRRDLMATRDKHGVYLASENYNSIMAERENLNKELVSKLQLLKVREDELSKQEEILKSLNINLYATQHELAITNQKLEEANKLCTEKDDMLNELGTQTTIILKTTDEAVHDAKHLHARLAESRRILEHNFNSAQKFKSNICYNLANMKIRTKEFLANGISEVNNQMEADKQLITSLISNQREAKEFTKQIMNGTTNQIKSCFEIFTDQNTSVQCFLTEQLAELKSVVDIHNKKAHQIITNLLDYSQQLKSKWDQVFCKFEANQKLLEKQKVDADLVQERLSQLMKMSLIIPTVYMEKLQYREDCLKKYVEKCNFLETQQNNVQKRIEDFGYKIHQMANDHLEILQRQKECQDALKSVQQNKMSEEDNFYSEIMAGLDARICDISKHVMETGTINNRIFETADEMLQCSTEHMLPKLNDVLELEKKSFNAITSMISENNVDLEDKLNNIKYANIAENSKIGQNSKSLEERSNELVRIITSQNTKMEGNTNAQWNLLDDAIKEIKRKREMLSSCITGYSEELFSGIHERQKEIETFFCEEIMKDEKTGSTPQRKEFTYPRRIVGFSFVNHGDLKQDEEVLRNVNNISCDTSVR
ncbi:hypothetical protein RUM44_012904 [Polyplax serrata]|uniref:Kinesin-like protein n=1 Tax=Polyplax serrata TaxID=468196 RepID=A0ABR1BH01_POLSC